MKRISIDNALTILQIIGEEDSIGFENDQEMQDALTIVCSKIEEACNAGELDLNDTLIEFC
jgi:hypothetical protein